MKDLNDSMLSRTRDMEVITERTLASSVYNYNTENKSNGIDNFNGECDNLFLDETIAISHDDIQNILSANMSLNVVRERHEHVNHTICNKSEELCRTNDTDIQYLAGK